MRIWIAGFLVAGSLGSIGMLACRGDDAASPEGDAGGVDATTAPDAAPETGYADAPPDAPSDLDVFYPANVEAAANRVPASELGGPMILAPHVVTITFAEEDASTRSWVEAFDDTIVTTPIGARSRRSIAMRGQMPDASGPGPRGSTSSSPAPRSPPTTTSRQ